MAYRFNSPPGWPVPPEGWTPPEGWAPDPSWPPAPDGWQFWLEVGQAPQDAPTQAFGPGQAPYASSDPYATTQQYAPVPAQQSYAPAPAPYSAETPGGGFQPATPYGPTAYPGGGGPGSGSKVGLWIGLGAGALVLVLIVVSVLLLSNRGGADPVADPTTPVVQPTDAPTSADPSDAPTSADPSDAPPPAGDAPDGTREVQVGDEVEVLAFDGSVEARLTLTEVSFDRECTGVLTPDADQALAFLHFDATVDPGFDDADFGFSLTPFEFSAYDSQGREDTEGIGSSFLCQVDDAFPSELGAGDSGSGWIVVAVPDDVAWVTYTSISMTFANEPGYAWAISAP